MSEQDEPLAGPRPGFPWCAVLTILALVAGAVLVAIPYLAGAT